MEYITNKDYSLVIEATGEICAIGQSYQDFRGDMVTLISFGSPPHKPSSTGRIATNQGEFFPSVIGAKWVPRP